MLSQFWIITAHSGYKWARNGAGNENYFIIARLNITNYDFGYKILRYWIKYLLYEKHILLESMEIIDPGLTRMHCYDIQVKKTTNFQN